MKSYKAIFVHPDKSVTVATIKYGSDNEVQKFNDVHVLIKGAGVYLQDINSDGQDYYLAELADTFITYREQ